MARPSDYNIELCKEICERVSNGESIKAVLESDKKRYPTFKTWCNWKRDNQELLHLYTHAREDKTEYFDEKFDSIMKDLENGKIDHATARVLLDALKWKMAKFYPKMFGDQSKITLDGGINVTNKQDYSEYSTEDLEIIANISKKYEKKKD